MKYLKEMADMFFFFLESYLTYITGRVCKHLFFEELAGDLTRLTVAQEVEI